MAIITKLKTFFKGEKEMKNILFVVGSLRKGSFNHQMAELAEKALEGKATVTYLDSVSYTHLTLPTILLV